MKKSKTFARKIVAIVLAVIMAASSFTGVVSVYASSRDDSHDSNLAANFMTWAETTDNQTCEALLDWVDDTLQSADIAPIKLYMNYVVVVIDINGYLDSVDGLLNLVGQVNGLLDKYKGTVGGDVKNIYLNPLVDLKKTTEAEYVVSKCGESYRAENDAKDIIMALAETLYWNSNDDRSGKRDNHNVIGQFIKGEISLGIANSFVDVYNEIGKLLGMWDGYESNLVYNIVAQLIFTYTNWFTESEINSFTEYLKDNSKGTRWNFDEQLLTKLTSEFISKISVEMTYALEKTEDAEGNVKYEPTDSSKSRYEKIKTWLKTNNKAENDTNIAAASKALGYDENLRYDKNGNGMIYLFRYGNENGGEDTLTLSPTDKFYDIVNKAFKIVWKTVLRPTLRTMRVNNSMDWYEDHGGNFDNNYYYWLAEKGLIDEKNWENNYTEEKFQKYAQAVYADYKCSSVDEFIEKVKHTFDYDRTVVNDPQYNWRDVAEANNYVTDEGRTESILFGKLRYSPLADKVFDMQTGPINLYFMQTGFENLQSFIDAYVDYNGLVDGKQYNNIVDALNNALVAAVYDLFPDSKNIGLGKNNEVTQNLTRPVLKETGANPTISEIASTLVTNACAMFEYGANAADANILNAFYHKNSSYDKTTSSNLSEDNFEDAMIPLLVACIKIIKDTKSIHDSDFDYATDAEGVAYVALREYLSFSQPEKDYDQLVTTASGSYEAAIDVNGDGSKTMFEDALLPMARDAVGYLLSSIVPCRKANGEVWDFSKSDPVTDETTLFEILNSVVCYYASTETFNEPDYNTITNKTYGKGVAALLGAVDENGNCLVKMSNTLWQNLSAIANSVWPTIGTLQYGTSSKAGQADAYDLIYDTLITSVLDINKTHGTEKTKGVTTIVKQLLTIFTAEPIMNKGIDTLIYDEVVASLVNGIFGAKISGQNYKKVIPTSSDMNTTTPFDSLVDQKVLARYKGDGSKENGVLGILIANVYCAFGGVANVTNSTRGDGCWQGAMFAVKAVSYFVNGFLPQLNDHSFGPASISVNDPSRTDFAFNAPIKDTYLTIKNESVGLNRFYKDSDGKVKEDNRYFIELVSLVSSDSELSATIKGGQIIAPEKSLKVQVDGRYPQESKNVKFTLTYNIYKGTTANPTAEEAYTNQTAVCYLNFSAEKGWYGTLNMTDEDSNAVYSDEYTLGDYGYMPGSMVLSSANPSQVENIGAGFMDIEGVYEADENNNAYSTYSTETIDGVEYLQITNTNKFDYQINTVDADGNIIAYGDWDNGETVDVNGVSVSAGYTQAEVDTETSGKNGVGTRTHVAYSAPLDSVDENVAKVVYNDDGSIKSVGVNPELISNACATPVSSISGLEFINFSDSQATYKKWIKVQSGVSSLTPGEYSLSLRGYTSSDTDMNLLSDNMPVTVADTSGAETLQKAYQNAQTKINPYQPSDYSDYIASTMTSETYTNIQDVFQTALSTIATAPTEENAASFVSQTERKAVTSTTTAQTGDPVYKPATTLPEKVRDNFYKKASNGVYYVDENYTFPVFTNELITDEDVKNGKDTLGNKVDKQGSVYYYVNDYVYEKAWDTTSYDYPYYGDTTEISTYETTENGEKVAKPYYTKVVHSYYFANGMNANASEDWVYTCAQTTTATKANDGTEYRSLFAQVQDYLSYSVEQTLTKINTSSMEGITGKEGLIETRKGKNSVNYDVASYEKMVSVAKEAEALVSKTGEKDEEGRDVYTTTATSAQLKEAIKEFDKFNKLVVIRGYEGTKLEAEIKELTGTTKANITATVSEDKETETLSNGEVSITNGTPKYGAIENGKLVNKGSVVYTDASWTNYVNALAKAVLVAKEAKSEDISGTYTAKKNVVIAENALEVPEAETSYTVSGTVYEAIDGTGTAGDYAIAGATLYNGTEKLGTTKANGEFTIEIPLDTTTTVTVKAPNGIERQVTFSASATGVKIGVVALDYNGDGKVNSTDVVLASKAKEVGTKISADNFKSIMKSGVHYSAELA